MRDSDETARVMRHQTKHNATSLNGVDQNATDAGLIPMVTVLPAGGILHPSKESLETETYNLSFTQFRAAPR